MPIGETQIYQANEVLTLVNEALNEYPPTTEASMPRKLALYHLDVILHNTALDKSEVLQNYIKTRLNEVIKDLDQPLTEKMKIYKIYNDGFLIRTKSLTVAFDLDGRQGRIVNDFLMNLLVDHTDILFISHKDPDHADTHVVKMFQAQNKPVYAPNEFLPDNDYINHIRYEKVKNLKIKIKGKTLKVRVYPGHQDELMNNIHIVTMPEGQTIAHMGDQYLEEDLPWLYNVHKETKNLNILIIDCWSMKLKEIINGFAPKLVITAHENEMFHTIDHREAFWLTYDKMRPITIPYIIMSWGEWYKYSD